MSKGNEPFFSIIIPIYNGEKYLEECIDSVEQQSFKNFEIVLVDDGSIDNSAVICKKAKKEYGNITYIYQSNSGPYNARIKGVLKSRGKYLLFLDSDDKLRQDTLNVISNYIVKLTPDLIVFNMSCKDDFGNKYYEYPFKSEYLYKEEEKDEIYKAILNSTCMNNLATKCVAKNLIDYEDYPVLPNFNNAEDLYCVIRIIDKATTIFILNQSLYFYRQNSDSTTHNYNENFYKSVSFANMECLRFAKRWGKKYIIFARRRCARACVASIQHILLSKIACNEKYRRIDSIVKSDFYKENITFKPNSLTFKERILYRFLTINNKMVIKFLTIISMFL